MRKYLAPYKIPVPYECSCGWKSDTVSTAFYGALGTMIDCPKCDSTGVEIFDDSNPEYQTNEELYDTIKKIRMWDS